MKVERVSKLIENVLEPILDFVLDEEQEEELINKLKTLRVYFNKYVIQIDDMLYKLTTEDTSVDTHNIDTTYTLNEEETYEY